MRKIVQWLLFCIVAAVLVPVVIQAQITFYEVENVQRWYDIGLIGYVLLVILIGGVIFLDGKSKR
ncbi:MAG: hypothetical protein K8L99_18255 [Anaerolineae bacterium]|nr:hypothetical protein [Anaerolineae bacterium]